MSWLARVRAWLRRPPPEFKVAVTNDTAESVEYHVTFSLSPSGWPVGFHVTVAPTKVDVEPIPDELPHNRTVTEWAEYYRQRERERAN